MKIFLALAPTRSEMSDKLIVFLLYVYLYNPSMKPQFIDHIVIIVRNIVETERFYSNFLGEPIHLDKEQVAYNINDTKIFFGLPYGEWENRDKDKSGLNHLAFGVRTAGELRSFERLLNEASIKNSGIKIDKYGDKEFIWFDDPSGIRLEFYCRPLE